MQHLRMLRNGRMIVYRIGVVMGGGICWFGWRSSEEQCLDTIAFNQRLDYDAGEVCEYVYEEVVDDSI